MIHMVNFAIQHTEAVFYSIAPGGSPIGIILPEPPEKGFKGLFEVFNLVGEKAAFLLRCAGCACAGNSNGLGRFFGLHICGNGS